MNKQHLSIPSTDETQTLHCIIWTPDHEPVGVMQLVHGMEEYIDRYDAFAETLCQNGWAVIGHDHLGHGESGKWERGFFTERTDGHDVLINDIYAVTELAHERWNDVPLYIFGHSMGSFFTRRYITIHSEALCGAIICGSGWYPPIATGTAYYAARLIGAIRGMHKKDTLLKTICSLPFLFSHRSEGKNAWLSKNQDNVRRYNADPLCGFGFTCGGYRDMYHNLLLVSRLTDSLRCTTKKFPILVISGADDPVGGARSVKRIAAQYRECDYADITEHSIPDNRHEILFEYDAPQTISFISKWLTSKLSIQNERCTPNK